MKFQLALPLLVSTLAACAPDKPPADPTNPPVPTATAPSDAAPSAAPTSPAPEPVATAPTGCTASPPITLRPSVPNASSPISAALTGTTLWVLHLGDGEGKSSGTPELLEVTDAGSAAPKITAHKLPPGNIGASGALAPYQGGVIGTYVGNSNVTLFYKPAHGDLKIATAPSGAITSMGSIAPVGNRALVSFGEDENGVHFGWFDLAAMRPDGAFQKIGGAVQQSAVADAFGGVVFFSDASNQDAPLSLRARLASGAGAPFTLPAVGGDNGSAASASGGGGRAYLIYSSIAGMAPGAMFPSVAVKVATITDEKGNGTTVALGPSNPLTPETSIQARSWGAMATFNDNHGAAIAAIVGPNGALIGAPIRVSADDEHVRHPTLAVGDRGGYVVWNQMGTTALRMAALSCK